MATRRWIFGLALASWTGAACGDRSSPPPAPSEAAPAPVAGDPADAVDPTAAAAALQRSIELEAQDRLDEAALAADEARRAGGGRDADLQAAKIAILREDFEVAEALLRPLVEADPDDAEVQYDLGLLAHRRGRYNAARAGYLAALRAREDFADARYNLAVLTWSRDIHEEARHHVERFVERWPDDPRAAELQQLVGSPAP